MLIYLHEPCQEDNVIQALKTCHDPCGVNFLLNATATFDQKHYIMENEFFKRQIVYLI